MKAIKNYPIVTGEAWEFKSKLCSVACSIEYDYPKSELNGRINELVQSFFNQWLIVITTYNKLQEFLTTLNTNSDIPDEQTTISSYVIASINNEGQFRDYTYLFLLSMKTYLDLFTCVVDITENRLLRKENELPDFSGYGGKYKGSKEMSAAYKKFKKGAAFPWLPILIQIRNKLIHRGYHLKPKFEFAKSDELTVTLYKGTNIYTDVTLIEVGKLFDDFMRDMPIIEETVANILEDKMGDRIKLDVSFKQDGLVGIYQYNEAEAS